MQSTEEKTFPILSTADFPDEFFKFSPKEEHVGETNPALTAYYQGRMKVWAANPEAFNFKKDLVNSREAFSKLCQEGSKETWVNWEENEKNIDEEVVAVYVDDETCIDCWVIKPKDNQGAPLMSMVWGHGGGGVYCKPEDFRTCFHEVALKWNACIILPKYRLAPEFKQPVGQQDFMQAFLYFHKHASKYGIDSNRMSMAGDSGGALVCLGALRHMVQSGDVSKCRICLLQEPMIGCNVYDVEENEMTKVEIQKKVISEFKWVYDQHMVDEEKQNAEKDLLIFPSRMPEEELAQMPMTFLSTAEHDFLRRDVIEYGKRLQKVGKLAGISDHAGYNHGWTFVGSLPDTERFWTEWKNVIEAFTQPQ